MTPNAIEITGLSKNYRGRVALAGLDLQVRQGEVLGYLGPNGAGKSTTIALLLGLARATSGSARIFGLDAWRDAVEIHRRLAYVPSEATLWPNLTGAETLHLLSRLHGSLDRTYRDELVARFALPPDLKVRAYSHGNRQKVLLVAAFASRAELLLLDEPTTGLDPLMEQVFRDCVREARERGQTVLLSSHVLSEVEAVCDRVSMLRDGRLLEISTLEQLRTLAAVHVHAIFGGLVPDVSTVPGVHHVQVVGQALECDVSGPIAPLLSVLAAHPVAQLRTHEPSLEELFVAHYGAAPA